MLTRTPRSLRTVPTDYTHHILRAVRTRGTGQLARRAHTVHLPAPGVPCLPRTVAPQAGTDEPAQLTASAALLGVATACMGTAYARLLKAAVTLTWKTGPALLPPSVDPTLFVPAVCTLGGALVGLLAVNLPSTTMPDFIGTQNGQLSLPGLRRLGRVLLLSP